jgi:hypothetical protein
VSARAQCTDHCGPFCPRHWPGERKRQREKSACRHGAQL